jgi:hypothetical protein
MAGYNRSLFAKWVASDTGGIARYAGDELE